MSVSDDLQIDNVGKRFGDTWVLRGVDAVVPAGKITAFVGPNGAGKTTLFHVIAGALHPDEGEVRYGNRVISGYAPHRIAGLGIGRQFQDVRVFKSLSAVDNVILGLLPPEQQTCWRTWLRPGKLKRRELELREKALYWLDYVGMVDARDQSAGELSFGQQKLLSLARLFAKGFPCLLLDEPTAGVSHAMVERMIRLIRQRVDEGTLTVAAFVEHNMSAVEGLADWIHFMHGGRVTHSGTHEQVLGNETVRELYMGI